MEAVSATFMAYCWAMGGRSFITDWWKACPSSWARVATLFMVPENVMKTRDSCFSGKVVQKAPGRFPGRSSASTQRLAKQAAVKSAMGGSMRRNCSMIKVAAWSKDIFPSPSALGAVTSCQLSSPVPRSSFLRSKYLTSRALFWSMADHMAARVFGSMRL